jgi:hypothetical protein
MISIIKNKYMKKIIFTLLILAPLLFSALDAGAQAGQLPITGEDVTELDEIVVEADRDPSDSTIQEIVTSYIIKASNYAVVFLVGLTVLVFMYGLMKYMFKGASSDTARTEGRKLMLWGVIGIFVMVSVWGLVGILSNTIGHQSTAVPQFDKAPHGTFADGTPMTKDQKVFNDTVESTKKTFKEKYRDAMRALRNAPQTIRQNANSFMDSIRQQTNRLRGNN